MKQLHTEGPGYPASRLVAVLLVTLLAGTACNPQTPPTEPAIATPTITPAIPTATVEGAFPAAEPSPSIDVALEAPVAASPQPGGSPVEEAQPSNSGIPSEPLPTGAKVETVLEGLNEPVVMAFGPSGRIFYIERPGAVRVAAGRAVRPEPVIVLPTDTCSERGMAGLALGPHFEARGYIYVHYTEFSGCKETLGKVVRFKESAGSASEPETVFSALYSGEQHTGGAINFGPDGMLYITTGDDHNADTPQDLSVPLGKMHRLNPDGSIPSDNPNFGRAGALPSIYAYGLRNSFDFTFDPVARGRIWASENGPHCDDEVNRIEAGYNYSWRAGYLCDDPAPSGPDSQFNTIPPLWFLPESSCCIGPTGVEIYRGAAIPQWTNELFICSYNEGMMLHLYLNEARTEATKVARVEGVTCTMDIVTGPDGALYYIEGGGGRSGSIKRIVGSR